MSEEIKSTNATASPPPVAAGSVDRFSSKLWGKYWERFPQGDGSTSEVSGPRVDNHAYCAVCGEWGDEKRFVVIDKSRLSADAVRMMTSGALVCKGCVKRCEDCREVITGLQLQRHDKRCKQCLVVKNRTTAKKRPAQKAVHIAALFKSSKK